MDKFLVFLESLRTSGNDELINTIKHGYSLIESTFQPEVHFGGELQGVISNIQTVLEKYGYTHLVELCDRLVSLIENNNNIDFEIEAFKRLKGAIHKEISDNAFELRGKLTDIIDSYLTKLTESRLN